MVRKHFQAMTLVLLTSASAMAMAGKDGQARVNELLSSNAQYRDTWTSVIKKEERLPDWVINLSGSADQMNAVTEDGDPYLVGPLCETQDTCINKRLIVAFGMKKAHAYAMLVEVPAGLPADKSPTRHADYRFIGQPDEGMQRLLKEQLKKDPNWY